MKTSILFVFFVLLSARSVGQTEEVGEKSSAKVSIKYTSDYVFMGRTDSLEAPYLSPSFTYYHKSGFFAKGSLSYLTSSDQNRIDLSVLSVGYDAIGYPMYGGTSLSGYFFNQDSYAVPSAMVGFLNAYFGYDFGFIDLGADASLGLSDDLDVFAGFEISRTFFLLKYRLLITPSFYTNAGSQNYYNEYYSTRNSKITLGSGYGKGSGKGTKASTSSATSQEVVVEEASKFQLLDYEFSASIMYKMGAWRVGFVPKYVIPVNPSTVTVDQDLVIEETLSNVFIWSVSVAYIIN